MRPFPKSMGAELEHERAQELVTLRRRAWARLLDYPPFAPAICAFLEAELAEAEPPMAALEQLRAAANARRGAGKRSYDEARDQLVAALLEHRSEARLYRALIEEVRAAASRGGTGRLEVRTPPRGSEVFRRYLAALRRAELDYTKARQRFVATNLRLVVSLARRYSHPFLSQADLIQEGTLGLLRAVDRFDPNRGTRFSTYAAWWIRHGITRAITNHGLTVRVPANVLSLRAQLVRAERAFLGAHGRKPSEDELAAELGVSLKAVRAARDTALSSLALPDEGDELRDEDAHDLDEMLDQPIICREVLDLVERLPGLEGAVLRKRFALDGEAPMTLAELGDLHCLSRERIRQIEKRALLRMRGELRSRWAV
jgi:RNA polymerase primary sigma factor